MIVGKAQDLREGETDLVLGERLVAGIVQNRWDRGFES